MADEEKPMQYDFVLGGQLAQACMALEIYRKDGDYAALVFDHAAGISKAVDFLEHAQDGLYTNVNEDNLRFANLVWNLVDSKMPADGLDLLLKKHLAALRKVQKNEKPDPADFSAAKALLYDLACKMTGLPRIYPGMVTRE